MKPTKIILIAREALKETLRRENHCISCLGDANNIGGYCQSYWKLELAKAQHKTQKILKRFKPQRYELEAVQGE